MESEVAQVPSFFARVGLGFRIMFNGDLAARVMKALAPAPAPKPAPKPPELPPEKIHASGLFVLAALQQEGRFIDFLKQEISEFSDEDVGGAARVVHGGCRKALDKYLKVEPVRTEAEGTTVTIQPGFDAQRVRLTGNVTGNPPFKGALKHHGWTASELNLPALNPAMDYRVIAPAEVELP